MSAVWIYIKTYSWFYHNQLTFKRWVSYTGSSGNSPPLHSYIPFDSPLGRVQLTYSWVQYKRIRLEAVHTRSPQLTMQTVRLENLHTKYLCRKILNKAPCSQILLLSHRPSQLTFSLSALVHSSIFPNSISNSPCLIPSTYIPIGKQLSYSSTPCNVKLVTSFVTNNCLTLFYDAVSHVITCTAVEVEWDARPRLFCGSLILKNLAGEAENLRINFLDKSSERKADVLLITRSAPWEQTHNIRRTYNVWQKTLVSSSEALQTNDSLPQVWLLITQLSHMTSTLRTSAQQD
jgi:hypothetical protein